MCAGDASPEQSLVLFYLALPKWQGFDSRVDMARATGSGQINLAVHALARGAQVLSCGN